MRCPTGYERQRVGNNDTIQKRQRANIKEAEERKSGKIQIVASGDGDRKILAGCSALDWGNETEMTKLKAKRIVTDDVPEFRNEMEALLRHEEQSGSRTRCKAKKRKQSGDAGYYEIDQLANENHMHSPWSTITASSRAFKYEDESFEEQTIKQTKS